MSATRDYVKSFVGQEQILARFVLYSKNISREMKEQNMLQEF